MNFKEIKKHILSEVEEAIDMAYKQGRESMMKIDDSPRPVPDDTLESKWEVRFYTGDYKERQRQANIDGAVCYVEQHFNASSNPDANYAMVVVANNASQKSKSWGLHYALKASELFDIRNNRLSIGGIGGRGNGNLIYTSMPAILLEPCFISNPEQARLMLEDSYQDKLAKVLADSIRVFFPDGGLVAFSIGHVGKTSNPNDRGASVAGSDLMESDIATKVMQKARKMLE